MYSAIAPFTPALEAVDRVWLAHPVGAVAAEAAVTARDDLLGDDTVADGDAPPLGGFVVELDDLADELVPRDDAGLDVAGPRAVAPELGAPWKHFRSLAQTPTASTRTSASPGPGSGTATVSRR